MSITLRQGMKWMLIPMLALLLLGATFQLREVNTRDLRERAVTWILRTVYEFAANKSVVPGKTTHISEQKLHSSCGNSKLAPVRPIAIALFPKNAFIDYR